MRLGKTQKLIVSIGIFAFVYVGFSHYYLLQPIGWLIGKERCIAERQQEGKFEKKFFEDIDNKIACERSSRLLTEKSVPLRQASIGETFFSYLTVSTILVLLLLLTKGAVKIKDKENK